MKDWDACIGSDPCTACTPNTNSTQVLCGLFPRAGNRLRSLDDGLQERRVQIIVLQNINLVGVVPVDAINSFPELSLLDLSGNNLSLPSGTSCAYINACLEPAAGCDLGVVRVECFLFPCAFQCICGCWHSPA